MQEKNGVKGVPPIMPHTDKAKIATAIANSETAVNLHKQFNYEASVKLRKTQELFNPDLRL